MAERQSAWMSKITNGGLTRSCSIGCLIAVPTWQQWASKGRYFAQLVIMIASDRAMIYSVCVVFAL